LQVAGGGAGAPKKQRGLKGANGVAKVKTRQTVNGGTPQIKPPTFRAGGGDQSEILGGRESEKKKGDLEMTQGMDMVQSRWTACGAPLHARGLGDKTGHNQRRKKPSEKREGQEKREKAKKTHWRRVRRKVEAECAKPHTLERF